MANTSSSNRNDRRDDRHDRGGGDEREQPWDAFRLKEKKRRNGEDVTEWLRCGVAWPMKDGKAGFTIDFEWEIPEGSRVAIMPRKPKDDR
jgi:hypothetical protein